jgi:hypothetical protein
MVAAAHIGQGQTSEVVDIRAVPVVVFTFRIEFATPTDHTMGLSRTNKSLARPFRSDMSIPGSIGRALRILVISSTRGNPV